MRLVLWLVNGEKRHGELDYSEIAQAEILAMWTGFERYTTGRWQYSLRRKGSKYYLVREWRPAPGLSWDEVEVFEVGTE